jgi:2-amino-4-hydroxy-6-hydroxymethyldihydropteridine diphosphokinase
MPRPEVMVYIGLGSNLDKPESQLQRAITELSELRDSCCLAYSSLYRSAPLMPPSGPLAQADYINAVLALQTCLPADELLTELQHLEQQHQRQPSRRWGPRSLDLDILLYGDEIIATERLSVPHLGLAERNFVLYPLAELVTELAVETPAKLLIPGLGSLASLLAVCPPAGLEKIARLPSSA